MRNEPWIHEVVMKFLPPQFPWNWCKCLGRNFIHLKIFNMTKYIEVLVKYATPGRGTTNGFIFQTINSKIESWGYTWPALTVRLKSMKFVRFVKCLFGHSHFGNSFSYKKEKDVASIVPWAEITSVPYSRVARWTFETSDMGFILLQRQNSWFATTWRGQYNRIFFFPEERNAFVLDHQHGRRDVTCKPTIPSGPYTELMRYIQLFRERLSEKMCTRQSQKVIWDIINTQPTFVAFL